MHIDTRYFHMMNKPGFPVYADVRLIAEVPHVAFLRLVRIWVPFLLSVLRGGWGGDDCRVNNGTFLQNQPLHGKEADYLREQLLLQAVLHQQRPKPPDASPSGIWLLESTPQNSEKHGRR